MTSDDISFDPALHGSRDSDARQVLDLVLYKQIGIFSTLEIAPVAEVLGSSSWVSRNIVALANARADDTRDWYFPVYTRKSIPTHARNASSSSLWCGIHHWTENEASATVHRLPLLPALPPSWRVSAIVASAGGLLLVMPPVFPIPSSETGDAPPVRHPCTTCGNGGSHGHVRDDCRKNSNEWARAKSRLRSAGPQEWKPLVVCNPLTKTWRELPPVAPAAAAGTSNGRSIPWKWRYDEVLIDMIVNEHDHANSYTIVMTFPSRFCMCVYTSRSNTWARHYSQPQITSGHRIRTAWMSPIRANAVIRGRLHYALLQYSHDDSYLATLRVFQIQVETGEWKPWREYALLVRAWRILSARFFRRLRGRVAIAARYRKAYEALRYLALVECMGGMYAVIPSRLTEFLISNATNADLMRAWVDAYRGHEFEAEEDDSHDTEAMPLQFHILGLNWDQNSELDVNGVLRIQVPLDRNDLQLRRMSLFEKTTMAYNCNPLWNWFSCTARGCVIWVTCEDYLLKYNVISGHSRTQIIRKPRLADAAVSYTPSFHMNP